MNSGYVPLGGVSSPTPIDDTFAQRPFPGGLTYSGHPLACAAAVAAIEAMTQERTIENADRLGREVLGPGLAESPTGTRSSASSAGSACSGPWSSSATGRAASRWSPTTPRAPRTRRWRPSPRACVRRGLLPFVNGSRTHVVPALNIGDDEARYGMALLDEALGEVEASL